MQKGKRSVLLRVDYITILIIVVFLAMAFGVFLYYKKRLNSIQHQIRQTSYRLDSPRSTGLPSFAELRTLALKLQRRDTGKAVQGMTSFSRCGD